MSKNTPALLAVLMFTGMRLAAQNPGTYNAVYSGTPWFDNLGEIVSAHGGGVILDNSRYYFFGEKHTDGSNAFAGFNCYSSADLFNWKFERLALPVQDTGRLGPNRVGERVKVMKCPATGEYVMIMHTDDMAYKDPCICYATSKTASGPYTFKGALLFDGKPIKKWDMGTFQDADGSGYLLIHGGDIYKLSDDYKSAQAQVSKNFAPGCESPAVFKNKGVYFWLASNRTSWERNDNFYYTAPAMSGPWTPHGTFAPPGTSTYNSQTTFVLSVPGKFDTLHVFMGDRWSYPLQASAATYVWQPLVVSGNSLSISANFMDGWWKAPESSLTLEVPVAADTVGDSPKIKYTGKWGHAADGSVTDEKNASLTIKFNRQAAVYSNVGPNGGYALAEVKNNKNKVILSAVVDMYCNRKTTSLTFLTPLLPKGSYTLTLTAMGRHSNWSDKQRTDYGSRGDEVSIGQIVVK